MDEKYAEWDRDSIERRDELDKALQEHGGNDVVTHYKNVAFAFPSRDPNPASFDYPSIDKTRLQQWAESKGWTGRFAPEMATPEDRHLPPVRFIKQ